MKWISTEKTGRYENRSKEYDKDVKDAKIKYPSSGAGEGGGGGHDGRI